jgi:hypothetical protein
MVLACVGMGDQVKYEPGLTLALEFELYAGDMCDFISH